MKRFFWIALYYVITTCAFSITVFGGTSESYWLLCFVLSTMVGMSGTWVLMRLYKLMDVNIATAVTLGGGFLIMQIFIALVFMTNLSLMQYTGIFFIGFGLFLMVIGEKRKVI